MGQAHQGDPRTGPEEHERGDDEGHDVALLVPVQSWRDEAPHLPQDHRGGQEGAGVHRHVDPQRQAVEGAGDVQAAPWADTAVRRLEPVQDLRIRHEGHDAGDGKGEAGHEHPAPELGEVRRRRTWVPARAAGRDAA